MEHIVIVGAGLAGARTVEQLRRRGFSGRLTLIGAEDTAPYDRPPLSKDVLLGKRDDTTLRIDLTALDVAFRPGVRATGLRPGPRVVETSAGEVGYDGLVIATGSDPIRLPGRGAQVVVRTAADAHALRGRLTPGARVVVVGAGWIGAEVATAALGRGCAVTAVECDAAPLGRVLGEEIGQRIRPWWSEVDLRLGCMVDSVVDDGVLLSDGSSITADVVVAGIGVRPATAWLEASGLAIDRGVLVDEWMRAAPGIAAVGDVAAWWSRRWNRRMRTEHWDDAASAPAVAVDALLAGDDRSGTAPYDPVPYFWSDQFGHKLQYAGVHTDADKVVWRDADEAWTAAWVDEESRLTAVLTADRPKEFRQARMAIAAGKVVDPQRLADPGIAIPDQ